MNGEQQTESNRRCALCGKTSPLQESHIVPRFVWRWLKKTSALGGLRVGAAPNKVVQDGIKKHLLCWECEQRFQRWETAFAEEVFVPFHEHEVGEFQYGPWLAKFAVSISWRVLMFHKLEGALSNFPPHLIPKIDAALVTWRDFLLHAISNPGRFEQHILPFDPLLLVDLIRDRGDLPKNINRYLMRSVDVHVAPAQNKAIVYAKMCRVMLVGFIEMPHPKHWHGTKIHISKGTLGNEKYLIPRTFGHYIRQRAKAMQTAQNLITGRQRRQTMELAMRDPNRTAESESFGAFQADVELFGKAVFEQEIR